MVERLLPDDVPRQFDIVIGDVSLERVFLRCPDQ